MQDKHVQFLQLRGNDLGDKGAVALAGALHTNTVLMDVYVTLPHPPFWQILSPSAAAPANVAYFYSIFLF